MLKIYRQTIIPILSKARRTLISAFTWVTNSVRSSTGNLSTQISTLMHTYRTNPYAGYRVESLPLGLILVVHPQLASPSKLHVVKSKMYMSWFAKTWVRKILPKRFTTSVKLSFQMQSLISGGTPLEVSEDNPMNGHTLIYLEPTGLLLGALQLKIRRIDSRQVKHVSVDWLTDSPDTLSRLRVLCLSKDLPGDSTIENSRLLGKLGTRKTGRRTNTRTYMKPDNTPTAVWGRSR